MLDNITLRWYLYFVHLDKEEYVRPQLPPEDSAAVHAYCDDGKPMIRFWRKFTREQRKLADAIQAELARLKQKALADDYFGALGIAPTEDLVMIRFAADNISERFSKARVRRYGLNRKRGDWVTKAYKIGVLVRDAIRELTRLHAEGKLSAYAATRRSALIMATARPATAPATIVDHQRERIGD